MTLLLYDIYLFFLLLLGPCILARHFVFIWDVQTLIIVYMDSVYGYVFMAMCMDVCLWLCVWMSIYGFVWMCFWMYGCVFGYVFMAMAMCLWLCVWILGLDPPRGPVHQYRGLLLLGARFHYHWDSLFHEAHFSNFWDLLLHEAHFHNPWDLLLHEVHLDDSSNFSDFSSTKMEKFAPVCSVE
jgi:hypothetical protein